MLQHNKQRPDYLRLVNPYAGIDQYEAEYYNLQGIRVAEP